MKRTFILFLFLITNFFKTHGQSDFLPRSLNEHDHNVWFTTIHESNIASNTFQQLKMLDPFDSTRIESWMSRGFPFKMQIFTFSDSLRIQTYDAEKKQLIKTEDKTRFHPMHLITKTPNFAQGLDFSREIKEKKRAKAKEEPRKNKKNTRQIKNSKVLFLIISSLINIFWCIRNSPEIVRNKSRTLPDILRTVQTLCRSCLVP